MKIFQLINQQRKKFIWLVEHFQCEDYERKSDFSVWAQGSWKIIKAEKWNIINENECGKTL